MCSLARARAMLAVVIFSCSKRTVPPKIIENTRHAAAARQCCAPIPGYPVIAAKLELAMNAADVRGPVA